MSVRETSSSSAGAQCLGDCLKKPLFLVTTRFPRLAEIMDPFLKTTVRKTGSKGVADCLMVVSLSNSGSPTWRLFGFTYALLSEYSFILARASRLLISVSVVWLFWGKRWESSLNVATKEVAALYSYRRQNNRHVDCGPLNESRRRRRREQLLVEHQLWSEESFDSPAGTCTVPASS